MNASTLLNILTAITMLVPAGTPADEMDLRDVADACDAWAFWWDAPAGSTVYTPDGRTLRVW